MAFPKYGATKAIESGKAIDRMGFTTLVLQAQGDGLIDEVKLEHGATENGPWTEFVDAASLNTMEAMRPAKEKSYNISGALRWLRVNANNVSMFLSAGPH